MTNKMPARVLTYKQGLPSYGDLKLKSGKLQEEHRLAILKPCKRVFSDAAKYDTIFSRN